MLQDKNTPDKSQAEKSKENLQKVGTPFDIMKLTGNMLPNNVIDVFIRSQVDMSTFFDELNKMETQVGDLALKFGGNREMIDEIKNSIVETVPSIKLLGGSIEDVTAMQTGAIKALQTQTILNKEVYTDLYAIGNLIGDGIEANAESTAKLVKEFKDAGYSVYQLGPQMGDVITYARDIGVSTSAMYKQLGENMNKLNLYNFENGVKGMGKMAAEAALLRLNMGDVLKVADKLFEPEDAIKMAAEMQALGVQVTSLLDPYKLMDMARNNPEELQNSLFKAASALTYFDEKNKKISILPGAQGQLRAMAKALNMSNEEFSKMAVNYADMERKMKTIKFNPSIVSEEDKKFIAGIAEMKDNKYQVTVFDEKLGQNITVPLEKLDQTMMASLKKRQEQVKKSPAELAADSLNELQRANNLLESIRGLTALRMAGSKGATDLIRQVGAIALPTVQGAAAAGGVKVEGGYINTDEFKKNLGSLETVFKDAVKTISENPEKMGEAFKGVIEKLKEGGTKLGEQIAKIPTYATEASKNLYKQGVVTDAYDFEGAASNFRESLRAATEVALNKLEEDPKYQDLVGKIRNYFDLNNMLNPNQTQQTQSNNQNQGTQTQSNQNQLLPAGQTTQQTVNQAINTIQNNQQSSVQTNTTTQQNEEISDALRVLQETSDPTQQINIVQQGTSQGTSDALKVFENPGTLKVTLYGDKMGLKDSIHTLDSGIKETTAKKEDTEKTQKTISIPDLTATVDTKFMEIIKPMTEIFRTVENNRIEKTTVLGRGEEKTNKEPVVSTEYNKTSTTEFISNNEKVLSEINKIIEPLNLELPSFEQLGNMMREIFEKKEEPTREVERTTEKNEMISQISNIKEFFSTIKEAPEMVTKSTIVEGAPITNTIKEFFQTIKETPEVASKTTPTENVPVINTIKEFFSTIKEVPEVASKKPSMEGIPVINTIKEFFSTIKEGPEVVKEKIEKPTEYGPINIESIALNFSEQMNLLGNKISEMFNMNKSEVSDVIKTNIVEKSPETRETLRVEEKNTTEQMSKTVTEFANYISTNKEKETNLFTTEMREILGTPISRMISETDNTIGKISETVLANPTKIIGTPTTETTTTPNLLTTNITTPIIPEPRLNAVPIASTLPTVREMPTVERMKEVETSTREVVTEKIDVTGRIVIDAPNLPPIWQMALNDSNWIEELQRTIAKSASDRSVFSGRGGRG